MDFNFYDDVFKDFPSEIIEKLKNAKVTIAGLGGIGSNVAYMLAKAGVSNFHLIDFDKVEASNFNRQIYLRKHLNTLKTVALKDILTEINPFCKIETENIKITENNVSDIFKDDKIIIEALDNAFDKSTLANILCQNDNKIIIASSGIAGFGASNEVKTKKIAKNLYVCGDFKSDIKDFKTFMPKVILTAAHQANLAISIILDTKSGKENF